MMYQLFIRKGIWKKERKKENERKKEKRKKEKRKKERKKGIIIFPLYEESQVIEVHNLDLMAYSFFFLPLYILQRRWI